MVESKTVAALLSSVEGTTRVLSRPNPADDETLVYRTCGQRKRVDVAGVRGRVYRPRGGIGGKRLTRMSTDLFLLRAKASWESKRSNRHRTSIYETRLRNEISSGEEGEILFFFFFFLLRILLIILSIYFSWKRILNYNTYMFT